MEKPPPYSEVAHPGEYSTAPMSGMTAAVPPPYPPPVGMATHSAPYPPPTSLASHSSYPSASAATVHPPPPLHSGAAPAAGLGAPSMTSSGGMPNYGSVTYVTTMPAHDVIIVGGCPACRIGVLEDDFSCLGIFCAIFFFPLGILCCLATRQRRCPNCGAIFG